MPTVEKQNLLRLVFVEAIASEVVVAAVEVGYAALALDPMGLLCIRLLSLRAATSCYSRGHRRHGRLVLGARWYSSSDLLMWRFCFPSLVVSSFSR